jgi:hypothetical protein
MKKVFLAVMAISLTLIGNAQCVAVKVTSGPFTFKDPRTIRASYFRGHSKRPTGYYYQMPFSVTTELSPRTKQPDSFWTAIVWSKRDVKKENPRDFVFLIDDRKRLKEYEEYFRTEPEAEAFVKHYCEVR